MSGTLAVGGTLVEYFVACTCMQVADRGAISLNESRFMAPRAVDKERYLHLGVDA